MRPPLRVIPGGKSSAAPSSPGERFPRSAREIAREAIEECRRRVSQASGAAFLDCMLFRPAGAEYFYTFVDQERRKIWMVFEVEKGDGHEYWKVVVSGNEIEEPEQLPRRPDKHEVFLKARAGDSPNDAELFAEIFTGGPEDYYQNP